MILSLGLGCIARSLQTADRVAIVVIHELIRIVPGSGGVLPSGPKQLLTFNSMPAKNGWDYFQQNSLEHNDHQVQFLSAMTTRNSTEFAGLVKSPNGPNVVHFS